MLYSLSKLQNGRENTVSIRESIEIPDEIRDFHLEPKGPMEITGELKKIPDGGIVLSARLEAHFAASCARCAEPMDVDLFVPFENTLTREKQDEGNDEIIVVEHDLFDIGEIALLNLYLNLSMKYLCREDCRGLCPLCGKDLNQGDCSCAPDEIDPRLERLKTLLEEKNKAQGS